MTGDLWTKMQLDILARHLLCLQTSSEYPWRSILGNVGIMGVVNEEAGKKQEDAVRQR